MNAPYLKDIQPTFVVHGLSLLQSKVSDDKMSEIITGHIKSMNISNELMVTAYSSLSGCGITSIIIQEKNLIQCSSLFSESSNRHHHSWIGALLSREELPNSRVSEKESMETTFLLPGILTESAMEPIVVDSFWSCSHKLLAEFQRSMLILTSIVLLLRLVQLDGKLH
jgi:hypothetical protein